MSAWRLGEGICGGGFRGWLSEVINGWECAAVGGSVIGWWSASFLELGVGFRFEASGGVWAGWGVAGTGVAIVAGVAAGGGAARVGGGDSVPRSVECGIATPGAGGHGIGGTIAHAVAPPAEGP
ncbi:MAG: hypothetical protein RL215_2352 [Planctomycetota bacterium]